MESSRPAEIDSAMHGDNRKAELSTAAELKEAILTRARSSDYLGLDIVKYAPYPFLFHLWLAKELVDNALDAGAENVEIYFAFHKSPKKNRAPTFRLSVHGDGLNFSEERIDAVFSSFDYYSGSKEYWKRPSRGFLGNALKVLLGASYALAKHLGCEDFEPSPLEITSGNSRVEVIVADPKGNAKPRISAIEKIDKAQKGTKVTIRLPYLLKYGDVSDWKSKRLQQLLIEFLLFNPDKRFHWRDERGRRSLELRNPHPVKRYSPDGATSIHWISEEEFIGLSKALTNKGHIRLTAFLKSFGIEDSVASKILEGKGQLLNQIDDAELISIYRSLRDQSPRIDASKLGRIGRENFQKVMTKILSVSGRQSEAFKYFEESGTAELEGHDCPFVLEIAVAVYGTQKLEDSLVVWWGLNHSPTYVDPTGKEPLIPDEIEDPLKILEDGNVKSDDPVLIAIHLITPTWRALNQSKTRIDMGPYARAIANNLKEVCDFYSEHKAHRDSRRKEGIDEARSKLEDIILERFERFQKGHSFARDERQTRNTLWYVVRNSLAGAIKIKRKSFLAAVNDICKALGNGDLSIREKLGIIAGDRGVLYFKGTTAAVSFDNLEWLKQQGSDVLFIEKEGVAELMAPYAEDKGIAILNSRGNSTLYVKQLLDFAEKSGANIFLLTDLDSAGLYIAQEALQSDKVARIGLDQEMIESFGFKLEALQEDYEDKRKPAFIDQLSKEDQQLVRYKRVELDALLARLESPELLWDYLLKQMQTIRETRDLRRSISISCENPPISKRVESKLSRIHALLEELARIPTEKVLAPYGEWKGDLTKLSIKRVEDEIRQTVSNSVDRKLDVSVIVKKLDEIIEVLQSSRIQNDFSRDNLKHRGKPQKRHKR